MFDDEDAGDLGSNFHPQIHWEMLDIMFFISLKTPTKDFVTDFPVAVLDLENPLITWALPSISSQQESVI